MEWICRILSTSAAEWTSDAFTLSLPGKTIKDSMRLTNIPSKIPQIPSSRDLRAMTRGTVGCAGRQLWFFRNCLCLVMPETETWGGPFVRFIQWPRWATGWLPPPSQLQTQRTQHGLIQDLYLKSCFFFIHPFQARVRLDVLCTRCFVN